MYRVLPIFERNGQVKDLIITCSDYRIQQGLQQIIAQYLQLAGKHEILQIAGSSLQFISNRQTIINMIQNLQEIHGITNIHLIDHMGCGVLCKHLIKTKLCQTDIDTANMEEQVHTEYLRQSFRALNQELNNVCIQLYLYKEDGTIKHIENNQTNILIIDDNF